MFEDLTQRLDGVLRTMRGQTTISEENISESLREVRRALLEADVQLNVARDFVDRVRKKALGQNVLKSVQPGQQLVGRQGPAQGQRRRPGRPRPCHLWLPASSPSPRSHRSPHPPAPALE